MPVYDYTCPGCHQEFSKFLPMADYRKPQDCQICGTELVRKISAPTVRGDYEAYDCPITGKRIEGRRAHEENLRRHGCRVLEPGETQEASRRRAKADEALEESIATSAAEAVATLPADKRAKLEDELSHGLAVTITRK